MELNIVVEDGTSMTFWVLFSSPLKWNTSLIAHIETGWWQGDTIVTYFEREEDLYVTNHKFIGLVTHRLILEHGGDLVYSDGTQVVSGFSHLVLKPFHKFRFLVLG
jgi:hypothetical protein